MMRGLFIFLHTSLGNKKLGKAPAWVDRKEILGTELFFFTKVKICEGYGGSRLNANGLFIYDPHVFETLRLLSLFENSEAIRYCRDNPIKFIFI